MIECKRHKASFLTPDTCIAKQQIIADVEKTFVSGKRLAGHLLGKYNAAKSYCGGCSAGLKLYQKHLEKEKVTMQQLKERKCHTCGDTYPLTTEYFDKFPKGFTLACRYCRGNKQKTEADQVETDRVQAKPDSKETPVESKICAWEKCGKEFHRTENDTPTGWNNRKYCSSECLRKAERLRDSLRKKTTSQGLRKKPNI